MTVLIAKFTSSKVPTQSNGFVALFPVSSKKVSNNSCFSNKSSPKMEINFSEYK